MGVRKRVMAHGAGRKRVMAEGAVRRRGAGGGAVDRESKAGALLRSARRRRLSVTSSDV